MKRYELMIKVLSDIVPQRADAFKAVIDQVVSICPGRSTEELTDEEADELYRALMQEKEGILNWLVQAAVKANKEARTGIFKRL